MKLLSVGEAAERLGVTVDVVRSLADSGELPLARTGGGHRRFDSADVDALKARWMSRRKKPQSPNRTALPVRHDAKTRYLATRFDPDVWGISDDPYELQLARQAEEERLAAERKALEEAAAAEDKRLAEFRSYAEGQLLGTYDVPNSVKAQALVEVLKWITSTTIPKGLSSWVARQLVQNQVTLHLKPHYDAVARAKKKEEDSRKVEQLIRDGNSYALSETFNWTWDEKVEAQREVDEELRAQVDLTWTITDVKELVNDVLYEDAEGGDEGGDSAEDGDQER